MELARDLGGNWVIDRDKRDRLSDLLAPTKIEGRDIDPVLAKLGAERADETRSVGVDDIDHLAGEFGFDRYSENLNQPRRAVAEQRALDALCPMVGSHRDRDQSMVIALALVANFAHGDATLFRQI